MLLMHVTSTAQHLTYQEDSLSSTSQSFAITAHLEMISIYSWRPVIWGLLLLQGPP